MDQLDSDNSNNNKQHNRCNSVVLHRCGPAAAEEEEVEIAADIMTRMLMAEVLLIDLAAVEEAIINIVDMVNMISLVVSMVLAAFLLMRTDMAVRAGLA